MSTLGTVEEIAQILETIAKDVSFFAPLPVSSVAMAVSASSAAIAAILKAIEEGAPGDAFVSVAEAAMKAASDSEMKKELAP